MILSNEGIKRAIKDKEIEIDPLPAEDQYTSSALDLFVGGDFQYWDEATLKLPGHKHVLNLAEQSFNLTAGAFLKPAKLENDGSYIFPPYAHSPVHILAMTRERIDLKINSKIAARVEGRSSLARLGLLVHLTAPTIHAGFVGKITLEMINHGPFFLQIFPNKARLCQLIFERLESSPEGDIKTDFKGQMKPSGSRQ